MQSKKIHTTPSKKYPQGRDIFVPVFDEEFERLASGCTLDDPGFCIACGADAGGCEPDARCYECESCGEKQVYGLQELLLSGLIA
jgi:hypothetical protein